MSPTPIRLIGLDRYHTLYEVFELYISGSTYYISKDIEMPVKAQIVRRTVEDYQLSTLVEPGLHRTPIVLR